MTIPFYDENGQEFYERTVNIDLNHLYDTLADFIPVNAHILDAGCGSGRDSKAFLERGYTVSAFDGSQTMVDIARQYTGLDVQHMTFNQIHGIAKYNAVWANASLLHIPRRELWRIFSKVIRSLKRNGIFYVSFKVGEGEKIVQDGRHFTYFNEARLRDYVAQFPELLVEEIIITPDQRPNRPDWLNAYLRRIS